MTDPHLKAAHLIAELVNEAPGMWTVASLAALFRSIADQLDASTPTQTPVTYLRLVAATDGEGLPPVGTGSNEGRLYDGPPLYSH